MLCAIRERLAAKGAGGGEGGGRRGTGGVAGIAASPNGRKQAGWAWALAAGITCYGQARRAVRPSQLTGGGGIPNRHMCYSMCGMSNRYAPGVTCRSTPSRPLTSERINRMASVPCSSHGLPPSCTWLRSATGKAKCAVVPGGMATSTTSHRRPKAPIDQRRRSVPVDTRREASA